MEVTPNILKPCLDCGKLVKKTRCRKCSKTGELNPSFQGGKTLKYWAKKRKIVDNYKCQVCGYDNPLALEVDHIIPRKVAPHKKFDINNLITLCANCHRIKTNLELKNGLKFGKHEYNNSTL